MYPALNPHQFHSIQDGINGPHLAIYLSEIIYCVTPLTLGPSPFQVSVIHTYLSHISLVMSDLGSIDEPCIVTQHSKIVHHAALPSLTPSPFRGNSN